MIIKIYILGAVVTFLFMLKFVYGIMKENLRMKGYLSVIDILAGVLFLIISSTFWWLLVMCIILGIILFPVFVLILYIIMKLERIKLIKRGNYKCRVKLV